MKENNKQIIPIEYPVDVFNTTLSTGINLSKLYCSCFKKIPNTIEFYDINIEPFSKWIEGNLSEYIINRISKETDIFSKKPYPEKITYILSTEIIVYINFDGEEVQLMFFKHDEQVRLIIECTQKHKIKMKPNNFNLIVPGNKGNGFELKPLKNKKLKLSLHKNYNDDLVDLHSQILKSLKCNDTSGLILFHGVPGTGKSTYIRYLANFINKKIIFLPPNLALTLSDPSFVRLLIDNPNSIIMIEDAEELLVSRNGENNSGISMLLNLTDGLLGSCLNIQFICTFNTELQNIDTALLRKGRLTALYEFKPLTIENQNRYFQHWGKKIVKLQSR